MKALVFNGPKNIVYQDYADPKIESGEDIVIAVTACSICGSDLHIYHGDKLGAYDYSQPGQHFCVGHEMIGEVVEVGTAVKSHTVGDKVMVNPGKGCGECAACRCGQINYCYRGETVAFGMSQGLQGGQAEFLKVPEADLLAKKIPEGVSEEQALLMVDALGTGFSGAWHAQIQPDDVAVVIGLGPVGLMAVESCFALGAEQVFAIDTVAFRRERAKQLGAIPLSPELAIDAVKEATGGAGADCVVEAVGLEVTMMQSFEIVRPGGRVSMMGIVQGEGVVPAQLLQWKNIQFFIGTANPVTLWPQLLPLIQTGKIKGEAMFTHQYHLSQGAEAYAKFDAREGDTLKMMIRP